MSPTLSLHATRRAAERFGWSPFVLETRAHQALKQPVGFGSGLSQRLRSKLGRALLRSRGGISIRVLDDACFLFERGPARPVLVTVYPLADAA